MSKTHAKNQFFFTNILLRSLLSADGIEGGIFKQVYNFRL